MAKVSKGDYVADKQMLKVVVMVLSQCVVVYDKSVII